MKTSCPLNGIQSRGGGGGRGRDEDVGHTGMSGPSGQGGQRGVCMVSRCLYSAGVMSVTAVACGFINVVFLFLTFR